jgi:hypothetical protein
MHAGPVYVVEGSDKPHPGSRGNSSPVPPRRRIILCEAAPLAAARHVNVARTDSFITADERGEERDRSVRMMGCPQGQLSADDVREYTTR